MYKLLIVDDEEIILNGIITTFDWKELGYEIVGQASNGVEALMLYDEFLPDVILTDIKMPEMDGLELLKHIKQLNPSTEVILLSGHDDFEYAKQGIRLGAYDYLLKLNLFEELENTFQRLHKSLTLRKNQEEKYNSSLEQSREYEFLQLIGEGYSGNKREDSFNYYCMLVVYMNSELKPYYLRNIKELLNDKDMIVDIKKDFYFIVLSKETKNQSVFEIYVKEQVEYIQELIESLYKGGYTIGIGRIKNDIKLARDSYLEASKMIDYAMVNEGNAKKVYYYKKENNQMKKQNKMDLDLEEIYKYIALQDKDKIINIISDHIQQCIVSKDSLITDIIHIYSKILIKLYMKDENVNTRSQSEINKLIGQLNKMASFIDLEKQVIKIITQYYRDKEKSSTTDTMQQIDKAVTLIDSQYHLDITLEEVAEYVYMSAPYFSAKFKEIMGTNFSTYIREKRLDRACQLLETTEDKIYNISKKVGYTDVKYFSTIFKKHTGMSPKRYKTLNYKKTHLL